MSDLKKRLQDDLKEAMKRKDTFKRDVIRFVMSAIKQIEVDERKELSDADKKNENEIRILKSYLPEPMSEDEIREIIAKIIEETGAQGMKDMGKVMGAAKSRIGSRAEGLSTA